MSIFWHDWMNLWWHAWIRIISMILMRIWFFCNPCNIFLKKPCVGNVYYTIIIWRKFSGLRTMSTSVMTITIKTQLSTNHAWTMGRKGDGLRPKTTSTITINTFSIILKVRVAYLLRPNYKSCTMTPNITALIFMNNIIHMEIITRYM